MKQHHCSLPAWNTELYLALAVGDRFSGDLNEQLNRNGGASLTVCPECMVDDFVHVEGCTVAKRIDKLEGSLRITIAQQELMP